LKNEALKSLEGVVNKNRIVAAAGCPCWNLRKESLKLELGPLHCRSINQRGGKGIRYHISNKQEQ
jgi:hypothetical protein